MSLTIKEVDHIAHLARIHLTTAEMKLYRQQLSKILGYFKKLQELDTSLVSHSAGIAPHQTPLREDDVHPGLTIGQLLSNTSQVEANQFKVPPVFEE